MAEREEEEWVYDEWKLTLGAYDGCCTDSTDRVEEAGNGGGGVGTEWA